MLVIWEVAFWDTFGERGMMKAKLCIATEWSVHVQMQFTCCGRYIEIETIDLLFPRGVLIEQSGGERNVALGGSGLDDFLQIS